MMRGILKKLLLLKQLSGNGSFVGPYDAIPSITAAYGMRRLRSAYTGNILKLRRASDNAESDFGYTSTGGLDTSAIATWLTATTGYVVTWYDQSGNGNNATQATAISQPLYVASGQNSKPVARLDGANTWLYYNTSMLSAAAGVSSLTVAVSSTVTAAQRIFDYGASNAFSGCIITSSTVTGVITTVGTAVPTGISITNNVPFVASAVYEGSEFAIWKNGAGKQFAAKTGSLPAASGLYIGRRQASATELLAGDLMELVIANAGWTTGQRQAAETAANAYWSIY